MIDTPYQFKSLASRVRGMHGALDADELAKLLGVAKVTILRRAKRGKIPSFRIGTMVRFDPQAISRWLLEQGGPVSVLCEEGTVTHRAIQVVAGSLDAPERKENLGCGGPIRTEYAIIEHTIPQRVDSCRRITPLFCKQHEMKGCSRPPR